MASYNGLNQKKKEKEKKDPTSIEVCPEFSFSAASWFDLCLANVFPAVAVVVSRVRKTSRATWNEGL